MSATEAGMSAPRSQPCDIAGCAQPIIWTLTTSGRLMPVDADPTPAGNVLLDPSATGPHGHPYAGVLGPAAAAAARQAGQPLRTHHRLSCTHPEQWAGARARRARR